MMTKDFYFDLPEELIAQYPHEKRGEDRLLAIRRGTGEYQDLKMSDFPSLLREGDVLVINDSKVRKARVYGVSATGGRVEFLFLDEDENGLWTVMCTKSKKQKEGKSYSFYSKDGKELCATGSIVGNLGEGTKTFRFDSPIDESFFAKCGHVPLPPYIKREDTFSDESRYQTVYAEEEGSVAAPTAGLHYTEDLLEKIKARGVEIVRVTLHVGMGTFLPVRSEVLEEHKMHFERYEVTPEAAARINLAKSEGRRVVCTGTTSVRTLESAYSEEAGAVLPGVRKTGIFIYPGYEFRVTDALLTNFHTPESTLLALVAAFVGKDQILTAYKHAVDEKYKFFSYGDVTFLY